MPSYIKVGGISWRVVESLGFVHSVGAYVKCVAGPDGKERMAVKQRCGAWRFWTAKDRIRPLAEHAMRQKAEGEEAGRDA